MSAGAKRRRQHMSFKRTAGSMCLGKDRYLTREAVQLAIAKLEGFARSYYCPLCRVFHLTSKPKFRTKGTE
jgi:hypothetical protein